MNRVLALDTNILLYALTDNPEFGAIAADVLRGKYSSNLQASDLVIAELLSHESIKSDSEYQKVNKFIHSKLFTHLPVKEPVLQKAAQLRRVHKLTLADAIHIASAIENHATHFITNDRGLLNKPIKELELLSPRNLSRLSP